MAQIITIISSPLITRLYGADAYGLSALFSSLVGIIAVVACLRYELSIMLPQNDEEAVNLLALSFLILSLVSLVSIPFLWVFGGFITSLLNAPGLMPFLWLVPLMVFLSGSFSAINYWNSRKRQFKRLSITQVAKAITTSGSQVGFGLVGYVSGGGQIWAGVLGQTVATLTLGYQAWKTDIKILKDNINLRHIKSGLITYRDFPKYDVWSALLNTFSLQVPIFILSAFFTSTIVGYYSMGLMVLQMPMSFIGGAIAQVFFQRAAEANHTSISALSLVVESTVGRLIIIGFFPIVLISIIGKDIFSIIFGSAWAEAGVYAQILSFFVLVNFVASPITTLFTIRKKLRAFLLFNIIIVTFRVLPLVFGGMTNDVYFGLILLSIFGGFAYITMSYWILNGTAVSFINIFRNVSKPMAIGTLILLIVSICKFIFGFGSIFMVLIGTMGTILYFGVVFAKDDDIRQLFLNMIN